MENEIDYKNYTAIDFTMDETFFQWVWQTNEELEKFWKGWLEQYPHKREEVEEARCLILNVKELMGIMNLGTDPPAFFRSKSKKEFKDLPNSINKTNDKPTEP